MIKEQFTELIDKELDPYLGRLDYGNLRKAKDWPASSQEGYTFQLAYELNFGSTTVSFLVLTPNSTLSFWHLDDENEYNLEEGMNKFLEEIKEIPDKRIKRTIESVQTAKKANIISSFEELLNKACNELKKDELELYTQEELDKLRNYFSSHNT
ncbi:hypothetical protein J4404_02640 [Candidatus Woesearchaeota archaeon]|nr:hypothetical protein [Candidatus Woesearchaeota archaeon]